MGTQPVTPTLVREVPPVTQTGVAEVLVGSVGLAGVLVLAALIGGALVGLVVVTVKRWRDRHRRRGPESEFVQLKLSE
ncbi:MAG: hypothetical protein GEU99_04895 [Luteitalea sp.]|nr:hypothetical protein [Luteitalea sp.]